MGKKGPRLLFNSKAKNAHVQNEKAYMQFSNMLVQNEKAQKI
jgi:Zn/Cd-binding protein ZinT